MPKAFCVTELYSLQVTALNLHGWVWLSRSLVPILSLRAVQDVTSFSEMCLPVCYPVQFSVASGNRLALLFRESWDPSWGVVLSVASGATDGVDESGLLELEWGGGS